MEFFVSILTSYRRVTHTYSSSPTTIPPTSAMSQTVAPTLVAHTTRAEDTIEAGAESGRIHF